MYQQRSGGPIGLRGTCALARLILQIFDKKLEKRLSELRILLELNTRYMDDGRAWLHPIKKGLRTSWG